MNLQCPERRNSARWPLDRAFQWRVRGGRRVRESRLVERSLNGMILMGERPFVPRVGQIIVPADQGVGVRNGMRVAVVRRVEAVGRRRGRFCVEILA